MTNEQSNFSAMNMALDKIFTKHQTSVNELSALTTTVEEFRKHNAEIAEVIKLQQGKSTGITKQKQKEEDEMIEQTVKVAAACFVLAIDTNNFELLDEVNVSQHSLINMTDINLAQACNRILGIAQVISVNLPEYGISDEDLNQLEKEISDFNSMLAQPRTAIVSRSQATQRLKELIGLQRNLLNQKADKLMLLFKMTKPVFYNEYKAARIIVNMGQRHNTDENAA